VLPDIEIAGASLVAVSPQLPKYSREMANLQKLSFPLLYDQHNETARQFRLVFALPHDLRQVYRSIGVDLEKYNGDSSWELAIPGVYVIGRDRRVQYASADPDYTTRPEPQAIIDLLKTA
jgi:peroxiredoxin